MVPPKGADDVPGPDRVVIAVDPLIPAGSPARVAEQNRCTAVDTGQDLVEGLVDDELSSRNRPLEEKLSLFRVADGCPCATGLLNKPTRKRENGRVRRTFRNPKPVFGRQILQYT